MHTHSRYAFPPFFGDAWDAERRVQIPQKHQNPARIVFIWKPKFPHKTSGGFYLKLWGKLWVINFA